MCGGWGTLGCPNVLVWACGSDAGVQGVPRKGILMGGDVWESAFCCREMDVYLLCVLVTGSKGSKSELQGVQLRTEVFWSGVWGF